MFAYLWWSPNCKCLAYNSLLPLFSILELYVLSVGCLDFLCCPIIKWIMQTLTLSSWCLHVQCDFCLLPWSCEHRQGQSQAIPVFNVYATYPLKIKALRSLKMSSTVYCVTWHNVPEDLSLFVKYIGRVMQWANFLCHCFVIWSFPSIWGM
jgi:hypothetical protein